MIRFVLQLLVSIAIAILVASSPLGLVNYGVIGFVVLVGAMILTFSNNAALEPTLGWILTTFGISLALGLLWPALPVILAYEHGQAKRRARQPRKEES